MTTEQKKEMKKAPKQVKSPEEQLAEFGSVRMKKTASKIAPSEKALAAVEAYREEVAKAEEEVKDVPQQFRRFAEKAVEGMKFKLHVMESNLSDPSSLSDHEQTLMIVCVKRIFRHCEKAKVVRAAALVLNEIASDVLPIVGTKY